MTNKDEVARQRINDLIVNCQATHARLNGNLERIWQKLDEIEGKLSKQVPPWAALVFSIFTALTVYLLTRGG